MSAVAGDISVRVGRERKKLLFDSVFIALHEMQTRSSHENFVCSSVKRVHCDKTEERSVQIFIPYERSFSLVF